MVIAGSRSRRPLTTSNTLTTRVFPGNDLADDAVENHLTVADCALLDPVTMPVPLTDETEWELCRRLHSLPHVRRLGDLGDSYAVTRGEINQTIYREYITGSPRGAVPLLKGVEVGAFEEHATLSQGHREWLNERALLDAHPAKTKPGGARIATQRISGVDERRRLVATLVESGAWFADSTNSVSSVDEAPLGLDYLLGLLNSDLFQWRFRLTSTNNNVGTNELLGLPVRVPDALSAADVPAHRAVCSAARRLVTVKRDGPASPSAADGDKYQRKLEAATTRLNNSVYDFYGLQADDRALISTRLLRAPTTPDNG